MNKKGLKGLVDSHTTMKKADQFIQKDENMIFFKKRHNKYSLILFWKSNKYGFQVHAKQLRPSLSMEEQTAYFEKRL